VALGAVCHADGLVAFLNQSRGLNRPCVGVEDDADSSKGEEDSDEDADADAESDAFADADASGNESPFLSEAAGFSVRAIPLGSPPS
jgi:hypothetical protein